ncbi:MAG: hypothetical protein ABF723_11615 [Lentilactobacillus hilgardii]|uniref:DUF1492 domain-containing protein n=2 Tax=Lentilactobacillus hilgardii TaxID=1588 RepID=A0A6P1EBI8_LENHI|nr:hypothetical protein [Lentilactobacillus hilgardii]RRG11316.1 MAG: hypothetical protein DUD35_07495 [Lactobacillus sp.]EEI72644.1 hypothetical protein HMPREF0496_0124 [Lentilactobacillus hilgardii ATCC 27305]MBZ2199832.1 hypothetical protein [Lentilactobacillus hilgardii]MBZ2205155.1 hypothetical protein [Lentilactobacillus hilgardii]MCT3391969.1 hypothetical protein [Lentilactobacillus hilgardii]
MMKKISAKQQRAIDALKHDSDNQLLIQKLQWESTNTDHGDQIENNPQLRDLIYTHEVIKHCLANTSAPTRAIITDMYLHQSDLNTEGIAQKLHMTRRTLYNRRKKFLDELIRLLG